MNITNVDIESLSSDDLVSLCYDLREAYQDANNDFKNEQLRSDILIDNNDRLSEEIEVLKEEIEVLKEEIREIRDKINDAIYNLERI